MRDCGVVKPTIVSIGIGDTTRSFSMALQLCVTDRQARSPQFLVVAADTNKRRAQCCCWCPSCRVHAARHRDLRGCFATWLLHLRCACMRPAGYRVMPRQASPGRFRTDAYSNMPKLFFPSIFILASGRASSQYQAAPWLTLSSLCLFVTRGQLNLTSAHPFAQELTHLG